MKISLIAVGKRMPKWVEIATEDYIKRLPPELNFATKEINLIKRSKDANIPAIIRQEGERILAAVPKNHLIVALDVQGKPWDTPQVAHQLKQWMQEGKGVSLLVGGPDGLSAECLKSAKISWSLSPLTLPHPLVRVVVAEQIYRAWSLLQGHPYHR